MWIWISWIFSWRNNYQSWAKDTIVGPFLSLLLPRASKPKPKSQHHQHRRRQLLISHMMLFRQSASISIQNQLSRHLVPYCRRRTVFGSAPSFADSITKSRDAAGFATRISRALSQQTRSMVAVTVTQSSKDEHDVKQTSNPTTSTKSNSSHHDVDDLIITQSCIARIQQLSSQRPNPDSMYLRLYVDAGGCSGFQYKFLLLSEDDTNPCDDEDDGTIDPEEDKVYEIDGARLVIDQTSLELLRGSTIDYVQEMIRSSFAVMNNPNSESACGCGSSFAVKKFQANPALD